LLVLAVGVLVVSRPKGVGLFRLALWSATPVVGIVADIVTLCGLGVALWARFTLGGLWRSGVVLKESHEIIERGPYGYVRHPIYSGVLLMMLGTMVFLGRLLNVVWFAIAFGGIWVKASREERLLTEHLPVAYRRYKQRVKWMLVPFAF
jgi:protein-S-isoprenylcysteine O-methyltransferase Ste14